MRRSISRDSWKGTMLNKMNHVSFTAMLYNFNKTFQPPETFWIETKRPISTIYSRHLHVVFFFFFSLPFALANSLCYKVFSEMQWLESKMSEHIHCIFSSVKHCEAYKTSRVEKKNSNRMMQIRKINAALVIEIVPFLFIQRV